MKTVPKASRFISKRWMFFAFKAVIAMLALTVLVKIVKPKAIYQALIHADMLLVLFAGLLVIPNLYVQFRKWRFLVSLVKPDVSKKEALKSLLVGFTFGFVSPGRVGELGRAFFIKDCPWQRVLGVTIIDKLFSVSVIAIMGSVGLLIIWGSQIQLQMLFLRFGIALVAIILLLYILLRPDNTLLRLIRNRLFTSKHPKIQLFISSLDQFRSKQARILFTWCIVFFATFSFQLFLLILAFEPVSPIKAFAASSSAMFAKTLLPISLGDIGIRESAAIYFFAQIGVSKTTAFNASFMLFMINVLVPSFLGLAVLLRNRLNGSWTSNRERDS